MKKAFTLLFIFSSVWSLGQQDIFKSRDLILQSTLFKNILHSQLNHQGRKALQFEEAYTTLLYDTTLSRWDSSSRATNFIDPLPNVPHKVAISLFGERYNSQFWIRSDSGYAIMDTSYNRYKVPEEYVFDTLRSFAWDSANASWVLFLEYRMTVNSNKDITAYETFINLQALGVPIPGMQPFARTDFQYNAQNVLQHWTTQEFSFGTGLQKSDSVVVTTNPNGYRTEDEVYEWDGSNWLKNEKFIYLYNANNQLKEEIYQSYDSTLGYINSNKNIYIYDNQGNVTIDSSFVYNGNWAINRIYTESYTSFGESLNRKEYAMDVNNTAYVFEDVNYYYNSNQERDSVVWKSRYTQNPNAPLLFEEKEIYRFSPFTNGGGSVGVPLAPSNLMVIAGRKSSLKMSLSWIDNSTNENGFVIERSLDSLNWSIIDSTTANLTTYEDSSVLGNTKYHYKVAAFNANGNSSYSNTSSGTSLTVGLDNRLAEDFSFYPNPTKHFIHFNQPLKQHLELYQLGGQLLKTWPKGSQEIDMSPFQNGLYLIRYMEHTLKIIKQ